VVDSRENEGGHSGEVDAQRPALGWPFVRVKARLRAELSEIERRSDSYSQSICAVSVVLMLVVISKTLSFLTSPIMFKEITPPGLSLTRSQNRLSLSKKSA